MKIRGFFLTFSVFLSASVFFLSCKDNKTVSSIEEKEVFKLQYGNFEDQLNLFDLRNVGSINTSLVMRDGFFYILNGEARKIMQMNSFGELMTFYYNPEFNASPSYASGQDIKEATRKAVEYAFNDLSYITVDSRKYLYVVDKLPLDRQEQDNKKKLVLSQIVLRFDSNGKFLDYIGQQGPGGTPFPYIKGVYTNKANELIVVSYSSEGYYIYWFSTDGYLLYQVPVMAGTVPNPFHAEEKDTFSNVTAIIPDYNSRVLYLDIDYYANHIDESSRLQSGVDYLSSRVYSLDVESGTYGDPVEILPNSEQVTEGFSNEHYEIPYDFLGVTESGWLFFIVNTDSGFDLEIIQGDGQRILRRKLTCDRKKLLYYSFDLSDTGILSALLVNDENARVVWWRTDSLIQSVVNK